LERGKQGKARHRQQCAGLIKNSEVRAAQRAPGCRIELINEGEMRGRGSSHKGWGGVSVVGRKSVEGTIDLDDRDQSGKKGGQGKGRGRSRRINRSGSHQLSSRQECRARAFLDSLAGAYSAKYCRGKGNVRGDKGASVKRNNKTKSRT